MMVFEEPIFFKQGKKRSHSIATVRLLTQVGMKETFKAFGLIL
jgi:hypothetical protein